MLMEEQVIIVTKIAKEMSEYLHIELNNICIRLEKIDKRLGGIEKKLEKQNENINKIKNDLKNFRDENDRAFRNLKNSVRSVENDSFDLQSKFNQLRVRNNIDNDDGIKYIYSRSSEANS